MSLVLSLMLEGSCDLPIPMVMCLSDFPVSPVGRRVSSCYCRGTQLIKTNECFCSSFWNAIADISNFKPHASAPFHGLFFKISLTESSSSSLP